MGIKSFVGITWARYRARQIEHTKFRAAEIQTKTFHNLLKRAENTVFGKNHHFHLLRNYTDFQQAVPIRDYELSRPWLDRIYHGESDITWPGRPLYLAKTSGTTSGTKYIPITRESIRNQIGGARDTLLMYMAETGKADFLNGKMMFLSGSPEIEKNDYGIRTGRLSGIVNHFVPGYLQKNRVPDYPTNIIEDWETKVKTIVSQIKKQDLRLISGIPPWVQMLFEELENQTGKQPLDVWPNLSLFVQGGVDFQPYQPIFDRYFQGKVDITELYPASEGFFAIQDTQKDNGLLLMPDYGVFYEFIPLEEYGSPHARRLTLEEVEIDKQYALIISTNSGLWAYDIGDTVKFTSVNPWKIRVSGRVKHFISAFGEHVISEEVNAAIMEATQATGAEFQEFTVAPLLSPQKGESAHEWLIEFVHPPDNFERFINVLDQSLRKKNVYYNDLREGNILRLAQVKKLKVHACREYMKSIGKLGGQNKFPRLSNNRNIADVLYTFLEEE
ncbi:MAG: GH3 auxin-responsive promoter family protein [Bacteroidia bacterium]|nr:GH3 auxin-responsive promoter family protein [Bacteroidia bacterium]